MLKLIEIFSGSDPRNVKNSVNKFLAQDHIIFHDIRVTETDQIFSVTIIYSESFSPTDQKIFDRVFHAIAIYGGVDISPDKCRKLAEKYISEGKEGKAGIEGCSFEETVNNPEYLGESLDFWLNDEIKEMED